MKSHLYLEGQSLFNLIIYISFNLEVIKQNYVKFSFNTITLFRLIIIIILITINLYNPKSESGGFFVHLSVLSSPVSTESHVNRRLPSFSFHLPSSLPKSLCTSPSFFAHLPWLLQPRSPLLTHLCALTLSTPSPCLSPPPRVRDQSGEGLTERVIKVLKLCARRGTISTVTPRRAKR